MRSKKRIRDGNDEVNLKMSEETKEKVRKNGKKETTPTLLKWGNQPTSYNF